jgi:hypothetical protein
MVQAWGAISAFFVPVGAISGLVWGSKTIQIDGITDSEIQETLDKLRKKGRIRDYK